jgi:glycerophosphoryl diester phosphodiesterase
MATQPSLPPVPRKVSRLQALAGVALVLALLASWRAATIVPRPAQSFLADQVDGKVVVLAHQGASGHAPSNTLESFRLAMAMHADILETDVHLTRDGVIVTSHDDRIDRLSNGHGLIKEMTLAELLQYDFGYGFTPDGGKSYPYRGKGVTIPTLEEVFMAFPGVRVNIEIKQGDPPIAEQLLAVVQKHHMADKVLINSFASAPTAEWLRLTGGRTAVGADRADMFRFAAYWLPHLDWLYSPDRDGFQLPTTQKLGPLTIHLDSPRLIERAHRLGVKVHYWTINDEATMRRLIDLGADGIITDYPDRAVTVLREMGRR